MLLLPRCREWHNTYRNTYLEVSVFSLSSQWCSLKARLRNPLESVSLWLFAFRMPTTTLKNSVSGRCKIIVSLSHRTRSTEGSEAVATQLGNWANWYQNGQAQKVDRGEPRLPIGSKLPVKS